jgi:hypothetical protein
MFELIIWLVLAVPIAPSEIILLISEPTLKSSKVLSTVSFVILFSGSFIITFPTGSETANDLAD